MQGVYEFSPTFQEKILALIWREPSFFIIYKDCVKPQYFESDVHIDLARIITDYYEKYEKSPTLEAVLEEVRVLCSSSKVKKEKFKEYLQCVDNLVNMDLSDAEYIKDKVIAFGRKQALTEAILKSVDDLKSAKDFSVIENRIKEANMVGQNIGNFGTFYFETIDERMEAYRLQEIEKIPTGIDLLDKVMGGGIGRGELAVVIAPPGTGKTLSLINIGAAAILRGKNVVHFSLEMSETRVAQRYDMRFTEKTYNYIKENKESVAKALKRLASAKRGHLVIKEYPTRTCSVSMIRSYLTHLRIAKGITPDLIIIDYPDLMKPTRSYGEKRHELELLYEEVRGIGQEFNCGMWGASQANRSSLAKKTVTIADIAESFGKAAVSDFMIALSQTKEEKRNGEVRYYIAKHRNGTSGETIHCDIFYEKMKVQSNFEKGIVFDLDEDDEEEDKETRRKKMIEAIKKKREKQERSEDNVIAEIKEHLKKGEVEE